MYQNSNHADCNNTKESQMLDIVNTTELNTENATNTTAVTSYYGTAGDTAGNIKYDPFAPKQVAA